MAPRGTKLKIHLFAKQRAKIRARQKKTAQIQESSESESSVESDYESSDSDAENSDESSECKSSDSTCGSCPLCTLQKSIRGMTILIANACCEVCLVNELKEQIKDVAVTKQNRTNTPHTDQLLSNARMFVRNVPRMIRARDAKRAQYESAVARLAKATAASAVENVLKEARLRDEELAASLKREKRAKKRKQKKENQKSRPPPVLPPPNKQPTDDFGPDAMLCVICLEAPKSVLHTGCGHVCVCSDCSKHIKQCPLCRQPDTGGCFIQVRVF